MPLDIPCGHLKWLHIHDTSAFWIGAAAPEAVAGVSAFTRNAFDHAAVA
tara:strand:+ start:450 stop:596 length:147 start_codon:yes stop_codon:yes gene_type:complete